jgi:VanZ family protein
MIVIGVFNFHLLLQSKHMQRFPNNNNGKPNKIIDKNANCLEYFSCTIFVESQLGQLVETLLP